MKLEFDRAQLIRFCQQNKIQRLSFFGSVLGDNFNAESDVDILVEFSPGTKVGLFRMASLELELSRLMKRKVDLRTPADLSRYFRDEVVAEAEVQYAA